MTHLLRLLSTEACHLIRSFFQVQWLDHRLAYTYPTKFGTLTRLGKLRSSDANVEIARRSGRLTADFPKRIVWIGGVPIRSHNLLQLLLA